MPIEITMPRLSDTMERGTIVSWNVKEGDDVSAGMTLGDIETDKATMELQSFDDGKVAAILLPQGKAAAVGTKILVLAEEGEDPVQVKRAYAGESAEGTTASAAPSGATAVAEVGQASSGAPVVTAETETVADAHRAIPNGREVEEREGGRVFASPLAKKIATERGLDLAEVKGTGPGGRITRRDVEGAQPGTAVPAQSASPPPTMAKSARPAAELAAGKVSVPAAPAPLPVLGPGLKKQTVPLSNMRRTIATRLVQSKTTIPHYQVTVVASMDALIDLRRQLNEQLESQGVKLSVNDFLVRACALAMHQHPFINASWGADGQSVVMHDRVNVGVAIALPIEKGGGLVVGVLRDADRMGLRQISGDTRALAEKARTRGLSIEEMDGATFTISNLGMFGVEHFTAIINPPNSAILAVGAAMEKPVVRDGQIVIGHEMQMTMSSDHRVVDGAMAAQYLGTVKGMLEAPATLLV